MWYFNSKQIKTPQSMVIKDITYPKVIFRDSDTLTSLGIKPYREVTPDSRYYHTGAFTLDESGDEVVGTYAGAPKDIDSLKTNMLESINSEVASRQGDIDWYWVRESKGGKSIPQEIKDYATTIYSEQDTKESDVNAMTTLDEIIEYQNRSHTEVRKIDDKGTTKSFTRNIDMTKHFTANPTDKVDLNFVSLTED